MERLTDYGTNGVAFIKGLRPCGIPNDCNDIIYKAVEKLARYEDAEEQGRLIVLPCAAGDTVYWVPNLTGDIIIKDTVSAICLYRSNLFRIVLPNLGIESIYPNAHLFLSREEARKALEGMK